MISQKGVVEMIRSISSKGFSMSIAEPRERPKIIVNETLVIDLDNGEISGTIKADEVETYIQILKAYTMSFIREGVCDGGTVKVRGNIYSEVIFSC